MSEFIQLWESLKHKNIKQHGGNNNKPTKYNDSVLTIVDVQNCFMTGGSFPGHENDSAALDIDNLVDAIDQIKEIESLIDSHKHIIFTRDYHPINHMSMDGSNDPASDPRTTNWTNVFPRHCRNIDSNCEKSQPTVNEPAQLGGNISYTSVGKCVDKIIRKCELFTKDVSNKFIDTNVQKIYDFFTKINSLDTKILELLIKGTEISYLFAGTKYYNEYFSLLTGSKKSIGLEIVKGVPGNKINIVEDLAQQKDIKSDYECMYVDEQEKKFIQLTKGEHCNLESYSAFNYHIKLEYMDKNHAKNNYEVMSTPILCDKKQSTGLCEYLEYLFTPISGVSANYSV